MSRKAATKTHRQMLETWKRNPEFKAAYNELGTEYALFRELLKARQKAGLTQAEVAKKMRTKPPAITRLETALADKKHSPTLATLKNYARAVGCRLEVRLVPEKRL